MNQRSKFGSGEKNQEQQLSATQQSQQPAALEFGTPEEMLRHDALHTIVPPGISVRLRDSIGGIPSAQPAWWRRLFGGAD